MTTIDEAIANSIWHKEIVAIPYDAESFDAHLCDLLARCDDSADADEVVEFWGAIEGADWRVHLRKEA